MSRQGSYWLFFVIVAVGLALSWGQVGRKTERVLKERSATYLVPEAVCAPRVHPCAEVAKDRALVLGPVENGLAVKYAGFEPSAIVRVEATYLSPDKRNLHELIIVGSLAIARGPAARGYAAHQCDR